jgi:4-amino-4-deoxy-L-arabinose transferase-like glycosyltransferase
MSDRRKRIADIALLIALMIYIFAGMTLVPQHTEEFRFMSMAHDLFYMVRGEWGKLAFAPPVQPNSEQDMRLINGAVNKNLIGFAWLISGRGADTLPNIYDPAISYAENARVGNVPTSNELSTARIPSALLTALGVIPAFLLGWHLRLRSLAYPTVLLYALHPVILLNGRRAMSEGSFMFFSLATMAWLVALIFTEHSASASGLMRRMPRWIRYTGLGVLAGLTVATKHSGLVIVISALLTLLITELAREKPIRVKRSIGLTLAVGLLTLATWFAVSPANWNDPIGALSYTISTKVRLLTIPSTAPAQNNLVYQTLGQRFGSILTQPFLTPVQYYESDLWAEHIAGDIAAYGTTTIDGLTWGTLIGFLLTALALIGLGSIIYDSLRQNKIAWAILIWTTLTVFSSLWIPMAWQRYYLPLILVAIVLAAAGLGRLLVRRTAEEKRPTIVETTASA